MPRPISESVVKDAVKKFATPFYLYDETGIRSAAQALSSVFAWSPGFKNFFAVKALPNPEILKILKTEGMGLDCSSYTELLLAKRVGMSGDDVMFSSNDTSSEEFKLASKMGATINLDDISHLQFLEEEVGLPARLCFRFNPGDEVPGNDIIGHPKEAKFGMPAEDIIKAIGVAQAKGVKRFALHTMVISNNLDLDDATKVVKVLFELAEEVAKKTAVKVEFINLGGGIGIPYKPGQKVFDVNGFASRTQQLAKDILKSGQPKIVMECGRYITGPYGYLISKVIHLKRTYKNFVGLDASMHNLMRPALYGSYHQIDILGKQGEVELYDVTGSLCENNDKFAIDRKLPKVAVGDIVVIHDTGAHGHAMGFNYNGKLRSAEVLLQPDGHLRLIRRAETTGDLFATLV